MRTPWVRTRSRHSGESPAILPSAQTACEGKGERTRVQREWEGVSKQEGIRGSRSLFRRRAQGGMAVHSAEEPRGIHGRLYCAGQHAQPKGAAARGPWERWRADPTRAADAQWGTLSRSWARRARRITACTCSRTSSLGERRSCTKIGTAPLPMTTRVCSEVPEAMLVSAHALSNCSIGLSPHCRNCTNRGTTPAAMTSSIGGDRSMESSLRNCVTAGSWRLGSSE